MSNGPRYTVCYTVALLLGALLILTGIPMPAEAQLGDRIRDRAQRQAERRVEQRAADAVETALDAVECAVTDQRCVDRARSSGQEVVLTNEQGQPLGAPAASGSSPMRPGEGAWVNYDFVPGERVIFAEDFTRDRVGDFPRRLEFQRGNMEVAEWQGRRWLRATTRAAFLVNLPETLPERFTLELDFVGAGSSTQWIHFSGESRGQRQHVEFHSSSAGIAGGGLSARGRVDRGDAPRTLRVMADGSYVKVYLDETRVANVPNADLGRTNQLRFELQGSSSQRTLLLSELRIAAGGRELYDALTADGRVVTHGVLFDTGSDRIRPESTPTLREIGDMLRQHGSLRLRIEGHTDNVGNAAMNEALSARRAESVRHFLVQQYGIDASRLEAAGFGQTRPVDSNDTPEGRQNNRRVELVRL